jgi:hypothetical protein
MVIDRSCIAAISSMSLQSSLWIQLGTCCPEKKISNIVGKDKKLNCNESTRKPKDQG